MTRAEAIAHLQTRLVAAASPERREWWERYMKGTASFRGVTMEETRAAVRTLWQEELRDWPVARTTLQELVDELGETLGREARRMALAKIEGRGRR